jgi:tetratricopeptide (TPR) repeat protein
MKMVCKNCGLSIDEGLKFCTNCGTAVQAITTANPPVDTPPIVQSSYTAPSKARHTMRNVLIAVGAVVVIGLGLFIGGGKIGQSKQMTREAKKSTARDYIAEGLAYGEKGAYEDAIEAFTKAIASDPLNGYLARGGFYKAYKQYDLAIVDLTKAIELAEHSNERSDSLSELYYMRGEAYFMNGG